MSGKSEKHKMVAGELYRASDPELVAERRRARILANRFNLTEPDANGSRETILRELFARLGSGVVIEPPFHCDYGGQISVEDGVFLNFNCVILDCAAVTIGRDTQIGPGVQILTAYHPTDPAKRATGLELAAPITIGANVWIGGGVIICPGVAIGDDTTIGAGSVVTKDVPSGVIAVGNPCRVLRAVGDS